MKIITQIPEEVAEIFRAHPRISRRLLQQDLGLTEYQSKIYSHLWKHGKVIAHHETRLKPKSGETKLAFILSDIHFPYEDELALKTALDFALSQNPDIVVLNGDAFDCEKISFWKTDPTRSHFGDEVALCRERMWEMDELFDTQKSIKERVFIKGNHEDRLRRELWGGSSKLAGLDVLTIPNIYELDKMGWKYVDNAGLLEQEAQVFKLGKLSVLHGHEVKVNYGVVNVPRVYYQRCLVNVIVGHYHRTQEDIERKLDHSHDGAWSTGCLCKLGQQYSPMNKWNHGFAMVKWDSAGDFSVSNYKIVNGKVL